MDNLTTEIVSGETYVYQPLSPNIVRAIGVCRGRPTFKYTRIEIEGALERLAAGESFDAIVESYQGRVSRAAMTEALQLTTTQFIESLPTLEFA